MKCFGFCTVLLMITLLLGSASLAGYRLNVTASLPLGLYRVTAHSIEHGGLAVFCLDSEAFINLAKERGYLSEGHCSGEIKPLGKEIFGLPGDVVSLVDGLISVNGKVVPQTRMREQDSKGRVMPESFLKPGRIQEGYALMLSPYNADSFDSRYFGLIKLTALTPVEPVLTWVENPKEKIYEDHK